VADIAHLLIGGGPSHAHEGHFTGQENIYTYLYRGNVKAKRGLLIELVSAVRGFQLGILKHKLINLLIILYSGTTVKNKPEVSSFRVQTFVPSTSFAFARISFQSSVI
jgi:hypothetical protein